jgi:hypothetical protein
VWTVVGRKAGVVEWQGYKSVHVIIPRQTEIRSDGDLLSPRSAQTEIRNVDPLSLKSAQPEIRSDPQTEIRSKPETHT